jgi:hypothetical protein
VLGLSLLAAALLPLDSSSPAEPVAVLGLSLLAAAYALISLLEAARGP